MSNLYILRTKSDPDGDGELDKKMIGVYTSREKAEACAEEIRARNAVQRHNVTTAEPKIDITEIEADRLYEDFHK